MSLIETYLPRYQFVERHGIAIAATPARVFNFVMDSDTFDDGITRALMAVRQAPARAARVLPGGLQDATPLEPLHRRVADSERSSELRCGAAVFAGRCREVVTSAR